MSRTAADQPRWASPLSESIVPLLLERGLTVEDLADQLPLSDPDTRRFLAGAIPMSPEIAEALHTVVGGSAAFWMSRAAQFVESFNWVEADDLARGMPLQDAARFGWIDASPDWVTTAQHVLDYFGVHSVAEWREQYRATLPAAQYRVSRAFDANELAVVTWMRQVERSAEVLDVGEWDPRVFQKALLDIRGLSRMKDPKAFYPRLQRIMSAVGVAVVIERPPTGCSINGATFRTRSEKRVIGLTARHKSNDVFWFTFFHEAGHVAADNLSEPIIDDLDERPDSDSEDSADRFAEDVLLRGYQLSEKDGRSHSNVIRLAAHLGIAPGIIVGQLQHRHLLQPNTLNSLKRRFDWQGTTLIQR